MRHLQRSVKFWGKINKLEVEKVGKADWIYGYLLLFIPEN